MAEQKFPDNIWDGFIERIGLVIDQIQGDSGWDSDREQFDGELYKKKLSVVLKALGHEATKLCLACSKPPLPPDTECESLLASVEKTAIALLSVYCKLPKSAGVTLRKMIKSTVTTSIEGIKTLAETIKEGGAGCPDQLKNTGLVWEETDKHLTLAKDNCEAACYCLDRNAQLIDDAHSELTESLNCDEDDEDDFCISDNTGENDERWTETDRDVIQYCLGLIKCSKNVVKKSKTAIQKEGNCNLEKNVEQVDLLVEHVDRLSPVVDELATCVYPPLRMAVVEKNAADLKQINKDILNLLKTCHFMTEDDVKWVEFLRRANTHNYNKIHSALK